MTVIGIKTCPLCSAGILHSRKQCRWWTTKNRSNDNKVKIGQ